MRINLLCIAFVFVSCIYARAPQQTNRASNLFQSYFYQDTSLNRANNTSEYQTFLNKYIDTSNGDYAGYDIIWVIDTIDYEAKSEFTVQVKMHMLGEFTIQSFKFKQKTSIYEFKFVKKDKQLLLSEPKIPMLLFPKNVFNLIKQRGWDENSIENIDSLKLYIAK
jgi:hypothetical protein